MSGIRGVSAVFTPELYEAKSEPKVTTKVGVSATHGGKKPKVNVSGGVTLKSGKKKTNVGVKLSNDGKVTTTVGHEVRIPLGGGAEVKLGGKIGTTTTLQKIIDWILELFVPSSPLPH